MTTPTILGLLCVFSVIVGTIGLVGLAMRTDTHIPPLVEFVSVLAVSFSLALLFTLGLVILSGGVIQ